MIHTRPRCFECGELFDRTDDMIFAPACGSNSQHDKCGSAVWHALCLMEYRERMEAIRATHDRVAQAFVDFLRGLDDE